MKKENVFFSRKEFLNLPGQHSTGNIVAHITKGDMNEHRDSQYVGAELHISDCSRTINLEFDFDDEYNRENSIHKVETMISVLEDYRDALKKTAKHQHRLEKKRGRRRLEEIKKELANGEKLEGHKRREYNELRTLLKTD